MFTFLQASYMYNNITLDKKKTSLISSKSFPDSAFSLIESQLGGDGGCDKSG